MRTIAAAFLFASFTIAVNAQPLVVTAAAPTAEEQQRHARQIVTKCVLPPSVLGRSVEVFVPSDAGRYPLVLWIENVVSMDHESAIYRKAAEGFVVVRMKETGVGRVYQRRPRPEQIVEWFHLNAAKYKVDVTKTYVITNKPATTRDT